MTADSLDPLTLLEREQQRLEALLAANDAWRALRQLEQREREGRPVAAIDVAVLRSRLEDTLQADRVFVARRKIAEAITLLAGAQQIATSPAAQPSQAVESARAVDLPLPADPASPAVVADPAVAAPQAPLADRIAAIAPPHGAGVLGASPTVAATLAPPLATPHPAPVDPVWPVAPLATAEASFDDLTLIRGIDRALADRLVQQGIRRFADIAAWTGADVRRVSDALDLGRAVSRQNWIEQSAVLAARRGAVVRAPQAEQAESVATAAARPLSDLVSAAARSILGRVARALPAPVAASTAPAPPPPPPTPTLPAEAAPALRRPDLPVAVSPPAPLPSDDLTAIRGLAADWVAPLRALGVTRFRQIARWSAADVARVTSALGPAAAISRDQWIEQAAVLATGATTVHVRSRQARAAIPLVASPSPSDTARDPAFASLLRAAHAQARGGLSNPAAAPPLAPPPTVAAAPRGPAPAATPVPVAVSPAVAVPPPAPDTAVLPPPSPLPLSWPADEISLSTLAAQVTPPPPDAAAPGPVAIATGTPSRPPPSPVPAPAPAPAAPGTSPSAELAGLARPRAPRPMPDLPPLELLVPLGALETPPAGSAAEPEAAVPFDDAADPADLPDLPDLTFGEADVVIVSRPVEAVNPAETDGEPDAEWAPRPFLSGGAPGSLRSRLRKATETRDIDGRDYAAYRGSVEEASVEIVRREPRREAAPATGTTPAPDPASEQANAVRRFLKAMTGQSR